MENKLTRNLLSALVIIAMISTMITLPVLSSGNQIYAASKKTVKVKFNANGGKFASKAKKTKKVTRGKKYGKLPKVTKKDAKFKGWYTKRVGGKKITAKTKLKSKKKHTLYAHWIQDYTLKSTYVNALGKSFSSFPVKLRPDSSLPSSGNGDAYMDGSVYVRFTFENFKCTGINSNAIVLIPKFKSESISVNSFFSKLGVTPKLYYRDNSAWPGMGNWTDYQAKFGKAYLYFSVLEKNNGIISNTNYMNLKIKPVF